MDNDSIKVLMDYLPTDWWQRKSTCQILLDLFKRYLLGLFLSVEIEGKVQHGLYTGFLLFYRENLMWATAGHIIDEIRKIISNPNVRIIRMRWLDDSKISGAESVPVHNSNFRTYSTTDFGIDFGVVVITGLDRENILKNNRIEIMTEQGWKNLHLANPEGYYIIGYPKEWVETKEERLPNDRKLGSVLAYAACLPVKRIEYPGKHPTKEFWNDTRAFYGRILPYSDEPGHQPENIKGMSGGPLISIERTPNREFRYRLFGIQRSWDESTRSIRVEPIKNIILLDE
jgi:hypothetical protein